VGDQSFDFGGRSDAFIHFNTGKLGLWDGGGFHFHLESRYGEATDRAAPRSGGLWPLNTGVVLPLGDPGRISAPLLPPSDADTTAADHAGVRFDALCDARLGTYRRDLSERGGFSCKSLTKFYP
jgi:hypothetical protein